MSAESDLAGALPGGASAPKPTPIPSIISGERRGMRALRPIIYGLLAVAVIFPWLGGEFYTRLAIEALLLSALALSVDILLGYAGLLSLGQAGYFGLAAYLTALCYLHVTQSFWLVALIVIAAVAVFAGILGAVAIRAKGVYFALITFGAAEILGKIAHNTRAIGGSDGLIGIPVPVIPLPGFVLPLQNNVVFYYVVLGVLVGIYIGVRRILATPFGSVLCAVRDNASRVPYLGYNPFWYKFLAFVLAAEVAAVGGLFYPLLRGFVGPDLFGFSVSTQSVVMALVGGIGTLIGPLVGGVVITFLQSVIGSYTDHQMFVLGAIFIVFVLFLPDGLFGLLRRGARRRVETKP